MTGSRDQLLIRLYFDEDTSDRLVELLGARVSSIGSRLMRW